jgi:hypothetical protein
VFTPARGSGSERVAVSRWREEDQRNDYEAPLGCGLIWLCGLDEAPDGFGRVIGGDGVVYVGSNGHRIYALEPFTGDDLWQRTTGGDVLSSPAIGPNGRLYVGADDNRLYALSDEGQTAAVRTELELEPSDVDDVTAAGGCQCSMARQPRSEFWASLVAGIALALGVRHRRSR